MDFFAQLIDIVVNLDVYLPIWAVNYETGIYVIIFLIIFCETGLVVAPFLPGDSLLFLIGTLCGANLMHINTSILVVSIAALSGDVVNYHFGKYFRGRISPENRFLKKKYIDRTEAFFERHGGKSIVMARFIPIIRTYAPFVAGLVNMPFSRFLSFSIIGALSWSLSFIVAGDFLGQFDIISNNIGKVVLLIVLLSLSIIGWEFGRSHFNGKIKQK